MAYFRLIIGDTEYRKKDKFLGITRMGSILEFTTFKEAASVDEIEYILVLEFIKEAGPTNYGNYDVEYRSNFYDKRGVQTKIKMAL